jgi:hypothetical protein
MVESQDTERDQLGLVNPPLCDPAGQHGALVHVLVAATCEQVDQLAGCFGVALAHQLGERHRFVLSSMSHLAPFRLTGGFFSEVG